MRQVGWDARQVDASTVCCPDTPDKNNLAGWGNSFSACATVLHKRI
jgi:hypothetical protein